MIISYKRVNCRISKDDWDLDPKSPKYRYSHTARDALVYPLIEIPDKVAIGSQ